MAALPDIVNFTDDEKRKLDKYIASGKDTVEIVFAGKVGTGKSSLVNGIIGKKVAVEGDSAFSQTTELQAFEDNITVSDKREVKIKLWDTPGLDDPFIEDESKYLTELTEHVNQADLLFYCLDMTKRLQRSDLKELRRLTKKARVDIWEHCVIALTFANRFRTSTQATLEQHGDQKAEATAKHSDDELVERFIEKMESWKQAIKKALIERLGVSPDTVERIPIIPTGYGRESPPDRSEWFSPFWAAAFSQTRLEAQPTLFGINQGRMSTASECVQQTDETYKMQIFLKASVQGIDRMFIGTGSGAVIGGLVGIVGGPVGVAIGVGVGITVGMIVSMAVSTGMTYYAKAAQRYSL